MAETLNRFSLLDKAIRISNSTVDIDRRLPNLLRLFRRDMSVDRACLFNLDRENQALVLRSTDEEKDQPPDIRLNLDDNFIGQSVKKRAPILVGREEVRGLSHPCWDLMGDYQSAAAFPIMDDQMVYGVLTLLFRGSWVVTPEERALIEAIAREMAGTIRNSKLYAESKKRIAELSVLFEVGRAVSSTLNLEEVLNTVVNISAKVLQAGGSALNVLDESTGILRVTAEYGFIPRGCRFKHLLNQPGDRNPPEVQACLNRRKPYMGPANKDQVCRMMREEGGDKSVICLPLNFKGRYKGTLSVYNKLAAEPGRPREFNREDLELLSTMGTMISSSLENALTFQTVDRLAQHNEDLVRSLSCLYGISGAMMTTIKMEELLNIIANSLVVSRGLGFDRALLLLLEEEEDCLVGAVLREVLPEDRNGKDQELIELLRKKPPLPPEMAERAEKFSKVRLPLKSGRGLLVRTAREQRTFNLRPDDEDFLLDESLPLNLGRYSLATVPLFAKGKVVGVIAVDRDISLGAVSDEDLRNLSMLANQAGLAIENSRLYEYIEYANSELSQTRERLLEAEKLAALGEMAAGMAHEIRNPLVSIGGFTRRILKKLDENSPLKVYIEVIIDEVTRLEKTLSEILDFSRDTLGHMEEHHLNDVVNEALYMIRRELDEGRIKVVRDFTEIPPVLVDERQVKHVFFNLFSNAAQAMEDGGILTIKTYSTQVGNRTFAACEVSDTGPGISPDLLPNIFNPFFTTKDSGTGLGLSIVHKIVTRHHGLVDVFNRPEGGAVFVVKLPVAAEAGRYLK